MPLNTYTECVWKIDINNLTKLLKLRDDSHAQYEIRVYAKLMAEALAHFFPAVNAAYERDRNRVSLNKDQIRALGSGRIENLSKSEAKVVKDLLDEMGFEVAYESEH